ncbi:MAG TPA: cytochrome P450 [Myxococcota bacterium]|nr:cytochrome P450 [Myxococcota bacterium]
MSLRTRIDDVRAMVRGAALAAVEKLETGIVFNPMSPELRSDPYPFYAELRRRDPFHRSRNADGWVLSRYEDVLSVLRDPSFSADERNHRRFKSFARRFANAGLRNPYDDDRGSMLRLDPPTHTRLRGLVAKAFTGRAVERMRPRTEAILKELVEARPAHGPMELVSELAAPLPVRVIAEMLGIPPDDHERFRDWSNELVRGLGDGTIEDQRASARAGETLDAYFEAIIAARQKAPKDDLVSALVAAEEQGDRLKRNELLSQLTLLLVAGNETTTNLISNAALALSRNPDQLELLRRAPERIPDAVEELLRYDSPVQMTSRISCADRELAGHRVRRGEQLVLLLASANRDPEVFADPDRLDVTRRDVRHLSFSHGVHFCLGAQLARLEASLALEALITRFPQWTLLPQEIAWRNNTILRGPKALWLEL